MNFAIMSLLKRKGGIIGEKTLAEYKEAAIIQHGKEQIKRLIQRGLQVPVAVG